MKQDMARTFIGYYWNNYMVYLKTLEALALEIPDPSLIIHGRFKLSYCLLLFKIIKSQKWTEWDLSM